jgi:hypothetical protein
MERYGPRGRVYAGERAAGAEEWMVAKGVVGGFWRMGAG